MRCADDVIDDLVLEADDDDDDDDDDEEVCMLYRCGVEIGSGMRTLELLVRTLDKSWDVGAENPVAATGNSFTIL